MTSTRSKSTFICHYEVILFAQNLCKVIKMSDRVGRGHARSHEITQGQTRFLKVMQNSIFGFIMGRSVPLQTASRESLLRAGILLRLCGKLPEKKLTLIFWCNQIVGFLLHYGRYRAISTLCEEQDERVTKNTTGQRVFERHKG